MDACKTVEASLRERIAQGGAREDKLRADIEVRKAREASLQEGIAAHKARAEKLRETVDACKATEARLRADIESRKAREASLLDGIAAHKVQVEKLRRTVDECKVREDALRTELADEKFQAEAMLTRIVTHRTYAFSPVERKYLRRLAILHPIRSRRLREEMRLIAASPLFDPEYYRKNNTDAFNKIADAPLLHFCLAGWREGRNPSAYFDVATYADDHRTYNSDENPLAHFLKDKERYLESYA